MATTADYLNKLVSQKNALADNLIAKGVTATQDETLETLVPKVLDISGGDGGEGIYPIGEDGRPVGDVIVPEGVTSLYQYIFYQNSSVTSVKLPSTLTAISNYAFQECVALTNLMFPDGITEIPIACCRACNQLESITLPKSLTYIKSYAFRDCSKLSNIIIPNDIGSLQADQYAFYGTLLDNDTITSLATRINKAGQYMFAKSSNLTEVTTLITGTRYFSDCTNLIKATILNPLPNGGMGDYAFSGCSKLETVELPDGLTSIGSGAFYKCSSLCNLNLPDDVSFLIMYNAFESSGITNDGVNNIMLHATSFGDNVFKSCLSLTDIRANKTGNGMFRDCTNLVSVVLSDITTISRYVFQGCTALKTVFLPSTITSDTNNCLTSTSSSYYVFYGCTALEDIQLGQDWNMSLRLNVSNNITVESMVAMFNSLKNLTGETAKTLTLGSTNLEKLTDEQKAIATNKNWTLA